MRGIEITKELALKFAVQALRLDEDSRALDKEFEHLFLDHNVVGLARARVRRDVLQAAILVLTELSTAVQIGKALDKLPVTRELKLPE
jgi:hypothetical protein